MSEEIKKPEIDLSRMQKLLDGFTCSGNKEKELKRKKYKSFCDAMKDGSKIGVDYKDLCMMLNEHGKISGYSNCVKVKDLYSDIVANVNLDNFKQSKAIAIMYFVNENLECISDITDYFEKLEDILPNAASIYFGVYITDYVEIDSVEYRIILTGSKINDDLSEKYNVFCFDESVFEISDYFLSLKSGNKVEATQFFEIEKIDGMTIDKEKSDQSRFVINILTNGVKYEVLIINNQENIDTFNSMVEYLLKYKRVVKKTQLGG